MATVTREQELLRELVALVRGECPSLLNEDSGGIVRLSMAIDDALAAPPAEDENARTVRSLARMLGWENVPPRETLERDVAALKARAQAPPASDPPGLVASLREQVRQWRDRASGIDDDNSYHFNSERHARANQMDECADEIEELLPASPQAEADQP